jgi:ankyrin repeat protein
MKIMRIPRINSIKNVLNYSFAILLLCSSCAESSESTTIKSEKGKHSSTPVEQPEMNLHAAVLSNNLELVKQHIEAGTDINQRDPMSNSTPLISAATLGTTKIAIALIDAQSDLNLTNNDGATALHVAAFFCRVEIVQLLIDAQADKTLKNNFGATPRESVLGPFAQVKPIYEMLQQQLSPIGLQLDLIEVEKTRPVIAMMLK